MEGTERKVEIELESLESQESVFLLYEDPRSGNNRRALLQKEIQGRNSKSRNCGWLILLVPLVSLFVLTALVMDEDDLFSSVSASVLLTYHCMIVNDYFYSEIEWHFFLFNE